MSTKIRIAQLAMLRFTFAITICLWVSSSAQAETPPAKVLDLNHWKLTLPYDTARAGEPDEVLQPELAEFHDEGCFFVADGGQAVVFRASCDGQGTDHSKYPRSELREMKSGGEDEIKWSTKDDQLHVLEVVQAITKTPAEKEHVVSAQIHGADDDLLMLRLEGKKLFIERSGADNVRLTSQYQLGDKFRFRLVAGQGRVKAWYNSDPVMDWKITKKKCYFKVGCYTQSNRKIEEQAGSYGEVKVYELKLSSVQ